jgi:hypothetical protein
MTRYTQRRTAHVLVLGINIAGWLGLTRTVHSQASNTAPSAIELAKMDKYLATRNDPRIVKSTIRVSANEDIDCVDRLRQHGYDDPIVLAEPPTGVPTPLPSKAVSGTQARQRYGTETALCPDGTVPILHLTSESLKRFNSLDDFFKKNAPNVSNSHHEYVTSGEAVSAHAVRSILSINDPAFERTEEMSLSQIWVTSQATAGVQTAEAGWQVYQDKWHDAYPHLFIYYTADGYHNTGCYNTDCHKFVIYNNSFVLGTAFVTYSVPGGSQIYYELIWSQNAAGDWWLQFNGDYVGYYPHTLYNNPGLLNGATHASYGGELAPELSLGRHSKIDMGSGVFSSSTWPNAAFHTGVEHCTISGTGCVWAYAHLAAESVTNPNCYTLTFADPPTNSAFYFGGPGNPAPGCN